MRPLIYFEFDYAILNEEGVVIDSSEGGQPLSFIQGDGSMIKGIERALRGKQAGDSFAVSIPPEDAYGWPQRSLIRTLSPDMFQPGVSDIEVGMLFQVGSGSEAEVVRVVEIADDGITVDANHPLAGLTLHFDIQVVTAREASEDEIEWMTRH